MLRGTRDARATITNRPSRCPRGSTAAFWCSGASLWIAARGRCRPPGSLPPRASGPTGRSSPMWWTEGALLPGLDFERTGRWLLAAWIASVALFVGVPSIDLWISAAFWRSGTGFPLGNRELWDLLRNLLWDIEIVVFVIALVACLRSLAQRRPVLGMPARAWAYIWSVFLIAPVLMANGVLKAYSGRARPANVVEFGGDSLFTRAGEITDQCQRNCSFVSGEVSSAVALSVTLWLASVMWRGLEGWQRSYIRVVAVLIPVFVTLQRISAGRHFASDAVFGALLTLTAAWALYALFSGQRPWRRGGEGRS
ncbi:phosphatase PAP2 family protein [Sinirhodobacter populi]|nr:phosphatase PAP2 family protein [Sinirhodobacter populi]